MDNDLIGPLVCVCIIVVTIWSLSVGRKGKQDLSAIPSPPWWPVVGHLFECDFPRHHRRFTHFAAKYGTIFKLAAMGPEVVMVADPACAAEVLGRSSRGLAKSAPHYAVFDLLWGNRVKSILTAPSGSPLWKAVRKSLAAAFSPFNLRQEFPALLGRLRELVSVINQADSAQAQDVDNLAARLTLDVIGLTNFHHDFGAVRDPDHPMVRALPLALRQCQHRLTNPLWRLRRLTRAHAREMAAVREYESACADLAAEMLKNGPPDEEDTCLAAQLLRIIDPATGAPLTEEQLRAELGALLLGGFETTAHTLSFALFAIACHPQVEDRLVAEMTQAGLLAGGAPAAPPDYDTLACLPYLAGVVRETLRMFPVSAGTARMTSVPTKLGLWTVPARTPVFVPFHALHNNPHLWDNPHRFCPERWVKDDGYYYPAAAAAAAMPLLTTPPDSRHASDDVQRAALMRHVTHALGAGSGGALALAPSSPSARASLEFARVHAPQVVTRGVQRSSSDESQRGNDDREAQPRFRKFMPFSDGNRDCVGQALAVMELRTALVVLLQHFSLRPAQPARFEDIAAQEVMHMTLRTRDGIRLHFIPRGCARASQESDRSAVTGLSGADSLRRARRSSGESQQGSGWTAERRSGDYSQPSGAMSVLQRWADGHSRHSSRKWSAHSSRSSSQKWSEAGRGW